MKVRTPRVKQAFMTLECQLACNVDLTRKGISSMIIGRVLHASVAEDYIEGVDKRYGKQGFMFNIHEPADYATGQLQDTHVASLEVLGGYPEFKNKPFGE